jgi:hypothetical protein
MKNSKVYSLCEAVADISYMAAKEKYRTENSREMIGQFIEWANEFEYLHKNIEWGVNSPLDYIESIYHLTIFKINQWHNI